MEVSRLYLQNIQQLFASYKSMGERAMAQLSEGQLTQSLGEESNSIAVIVKHLRGNMLSRWTNFLTEDGEKPWRKRDREFEADLHSREAIMAAWEEGWACLFEAIRPLQADQVLQTIHIRGEVHTVLEAANRQLTHYSYHIGQIVLLAKHWRGGEWQTLSIPRGESEQFNQQKFGKA
jgi:hypothetical protein